MSQNWPNVIVRVSVKSDFENLKVYNLKIKKKCIISYNIFSLFYTKSQKILFRIIILQNNFCQFFNFVAGSLPQQTDSLVSVQWKHIMSWLPVRRPLSLLLLTNINNHGNIIKSTSKRNNNNNWIATSVPPTCLELLYCQSQL